MRLEVQNMTGDEMPIGKELLDISENRNLLFRCGHGPPRRF